MIVRAGILAAALSLLLAGAASAADPPPNARPNPGELWRGFPLDPVVSTPSSPRSTNPAGPPRPADPGPAPGAVAGGAEDRWRPVVLGGLAGSILVAVSGSALVAVRRRQRQLAPMPIGRAPRELIDEALALAREARECDMLLHRQRREGAIAVSEIPDKVVPVSEAAPSAEEAALGSSVSSSYAEIGERVAGVLSAAEAAADRIRADARQEAEELLGQARRETDQVRAEATAYDSDTRAAVESYATERRRQADQQERKQLADGEAQARATREAAVESARDIEEAARQRGKALREQSRAVEEWLQKAVQGLHRMTAQLEDLLGTTASPTEDESLADALKPAVREGDARQALVASSGDGDLKPLTALKDERKT